MPDRITRSRTKGWRKPPGAVIVGGESGPGARPMHPDWARSLRDQCVELARLCAARPHLCRAMLRLWREFIFPAVADVHGRQIAISYQDADLHSGQTYRFDGWVMIGRGGRGGRDSRTGRQSRDLRIWAWPPSAAAQIGATP